MGQQVAANPPDQGTKINAVCACWSPYVCSEGESALQPLLAFTAAHASCLSAALHRVARRIRMHYASPACTALATFDCAAIRLHTQRTVKQAIEMIHTLTQLTQKIHADTPSHDICLNSLLTVHLPERMHSAPLHAFSRVLTP